MLTAPARAAKAVAVLSAAWASQQHQDSGESTGHWRGRGTSFIVVQCLLLRSSMDMRHQLHRSSPLPPHQTRISMPASGQKSTTTQKQCQQAEENDDDDDDDDDEHGNKATSTKYATSTYTTSIHPRCTYVHTCNATVRPKTAAEEVNTACPCSQLSDALGSDTPRNLRVFVHSVAYRRRYEMA